MSKILFVFFLLILFSIPIFCLEEDYYNKILLDSINHFPEEFKNIIDKNYLISGNEKAFEEIKNYLPLIESKKHNKWFIEICNSKIDEIRFLNNFHPSNSLMSYQFGKLAGYLLIAVDPFNEKRKENSKLIESIEGELTTDKIIAKYDGTNKILDLVGEIADIEKLNTQDGETLINLFNHSDKNFQNLYTKIINRTTNFLIDELYSLWESMKENKKEEKVPIRDILGLPKSEKNIKIKEPDNPIPPEKPDLKKH